MLSRIVTCRKNCETLICSPLKITSLHLLSKFRGYIFNGLRENGFENCQLKYSVPTLMVLRSFEAEVSLTKAQVSSKLLFES